MFLKRSFIGKKTLSVMLVCAMVSAVGVTSAITTTATVNDKQTADATTVQTESSANAYGLKDNIQDGVILHAWEWSLSNIKEKLPQIAQAGYTAVQTTVLQHCKESTAGKANDGWWVYYQPASFALETQSGYSALGTKADLERAKETMSGNALINYWESQNDKLRNLGIRPLTLESLE